jgi:glutathione S-transferase
VQQAIIPDEAVLQQEMEGIFGFISNHYFKESVFMIGKSLTVADIAAYFEMSTLELVDFSFSKWENISKWMKAMQ